MHRAALVLVPMLAVISLVWYLWVEPGLASVLRRWLATMLAWLGVAAVNISAGSPYYNPHMQRPAIFPPFSPVKLLMAAVEFMYVSGTLSPDLQVLAQETVSTGGMLVVLDTGATLWDGGTAAACRGHRKR